MSVDKNIRILLVEDSAPARKIEGRILRKTLGFETVLDAVDAEQAIEMLEGGEQVDLIISDWNMNQLTGLDLLKWVRSQDAISHVPFIMATGQGEKKQIMLANEAGGNGVVSKPFTPDDLMVKIEEAMSGADTSASTVKARQPVIGADGKVVFNIGHIQITDHLVLGVAKDMIESGQVHPKHFTLQTQCYKSWNPVAASLEEGSADGALILAPMAMDLFGFGVPIKLVLLAHKNGSIMVRNKLNRGIGKELFQGKSFYLPHQLSVHHLLSHAYLTQLGLNPGVAGKSSGDMNLEIVPPIQMPELLNGNPDAGGYLVAEPLGTKSIAAGNAQQVMLTGEVWEGHPCCVCVFRQELIEQHPDAVQELVNLLVQAGKFIDQQPEKSAQIAVKFLDPTGELGLKEQVLFNVLNEPAGIKTDDLYPIVSDLNAMQEYLHNKMDVGSLIDIHAFLDLQFADKACAKIPPADQPTTFAPESFLDKVRAARTGESMAKKMIGKEGQYLFATSAGEEYGIGIMTIREIVSNQDLIKVPEAEPYIRGVMNLRGIMIPVLDLNLWFGYEPIEENDRIAIIVVEKEVGDESVALGIMVEGVSEIIDVTAENVESVPEMMAHAEYILAMTKMKGEVRTLLDVQRIISSAA